MSKAGWLSFLMTMIGLLSIEVDGQPTVDDNPSCEATTLYEITNGFTEVKNQISKDLAEVKNLLGSRQQTCSAVNASSLCEYKTHSSLIQVFNLLMDVSTVSALCFFEYTIKLSNKYATNVLS